MRGYDNDIRLYTPVLQRVIILVAVIIAVPVVLWTITAFVRSYVGPPKAPTFQRMTMLEPSDSSAAAPPASYLVPQQAQAPAPGPQIANAPTTITDARTPLLEIKRPLAGDPSQAAAATGPPANAPIPAPPAAMAAPPVSAQPAAAATPPMAAPSPPILPTRTPPLGAAQDSSVPAASDRSFAWPNQPTNLASNSGANNATASGPALAAQQSSNDSSADDTSAKDLPAVQPMAGRIPLPRRRPNEVAMTQIAGLSAVSPSAVPLPRARPVDAPEPAPVTGNDATFYDRDAAH